MASNSFKKRVREIFVREKSYFNKGLGEISGIKSLISLYFIVGIYLNQLNIKVDFWAISVSFLAIVVILNRIGWLWDKAHLYVEENEFNNKRNNFVREVLKRFKQ